MRQPVILIAAAFCATFLAAGCVPKPAAPAAARQTAAAPVPSAQQPAAPQQPASIRTPPPQASAGTAAAPAPAPPPATPATSAEFLQVSRGAAVPARDFRIGRIRAAVAAQDAAGETLARFLDALVLGAVPAELYDPASRDRLSRSIDYYAGKGMRPVRYRIGEVADSGDGGAVASVRLFGSTGVTEGEVYLGSTDGQWGITDIQVGFALLLEAAPVRTEPFVPSSYEYRGSSSSGNGE